MLGNRWLFSPLEPRVNQGKDAFVLFATFCYACLFVLIHPKPVRIKVKRSCVSVLSVSLPVCLSGCRESPVRAPPPASSPCFSVVPSEWNDPSVRRWFSSSPSTFRPRAVSRYTISFYWKTRALCLGEIARLKLLFSPRRISRSKPSEMKD